MSYESHPDKEDTIIVRDYSLGTDFHEVAELLHSEGMFNPERDRYDRLREAWPRFVMKVALAMGERVVGSVYVNEGIGIVEGLVVHPDFRGRGIGGMLLDAAERALRIKGHKYIELQIDEGRDDLEAWYKKQGFEVRYRVTGMMRQIEPDLPRRETLEIASDRETVNQAFMNIYMRYRYRHGYFEPLHCPEEFTDLTPEEEYDVLRQSPLLSLRRLNEIRNAKGYDKPPIEGERIAYSPIFSQEVNEIFKHAPIPQLQNACFAGRAWQYTYATPWLPLSAEDKGPEEILVQAWVGRSWEIAYPIERRLGSTGTDKYEDAFYAYPNDAFLFLHQLKGIEKFGRPPFMGEQHFGGNFLCYDQANKNIFAFHVNENGIERLGPEETAIMQEDLVLYANAYKTIARDFWLKPPRNRSRRT